MARSVLPTPGCLKPAQRLAKLSELMLSDSVNEERSEVKESWARGGGFFGPRHTLEEGPPQGDESSHGGGWRCGWSREPVLSPQAPPAGAIQQMAGIKAVLGPQPLSE